MYNKEVNRHKRNSQIGQSKLKFPTLKQMRKPAIIVGASLLALVVVAQIAYPQDRALPFSKLGSRSIGWMQPGDISRQAQAAYATSKAEVRGEDKIYFSHKLSKIGVKLDTDMLVAQATEYAWWNRLIPFSALWSGRIIEYMPVKVDQSEIKKFITDEADSLDVSAENALLTIDGVSVKTEPGRSGARIKADGLISAIQKAHYAVGGVTQLATPVALSEPAINEKDLVGLQGRAQEIIDRKIQLVFEDMKVLVDAGIVADWLVIEQADAQSVDDIAIVTDASKVQKFVTEKFAEKVTVKAGVTELTLVDGVERSRKNGPDGRTIDGEKSAEVISAYLLGEAGDSSEVAVSVKRTPATIKKYQTFSKSQGGLQAYLNSLADEGDIRVTVSQRGGSGWYASYRGGDQTVAASTYKVYVVAYALNQISEGALSYDDQINGMTLRQCMEFAIVRSDNGCPEAMIEKFGRTELNNFLYARGYSRATTFTHRTASQTTTNDLVKAMADIHSGSLVKGAERDFLLGIMGRTNHRQGIPAGTSAHAQNKVGFLWGYLNDAAVVNHSSGTYAISIMTNGQSWIKIAEITRKVESLMYP